MAMEDDEGETGAIRAAVRSAKKEYRPAKLGEPEKRPPRAGANKKKQKPRESGGGVKGTFEKDLGQRSVREGVRAKKGDIIGGMKKKGGKPRTK